MRYLTGHFSNPREYHRSKTRTVSPETLHFRWDKINLGRRCSRLELCSWFLIIPFTTNGEITKLKFQHVKQMKLLQNNVTDKTPMCIPTKGVTVREHNLTLNSYFRSSGFQLNSNINNNNLCKMFCNHRFQTFLFFLCCFRCKPKYLERSISSNIKCCTSKAPSLLFQVI